MRRTCYLLSVLLLIGCSQSGGSSLPATDHSGPHHATTSAQFKTLFGFDKAKYGYIPVGALLSLNGQFYGTTNFGGHHSSICYPGNGCGVVYQLTTAGVQTVTYAFKGTTSGARPYAGLVAINNTMYGTTQNGGKKNKGAVFALTPSGTETELHSFSGKDGEDARAGLVVVNNVLYGTTYYGGSAQTGTLFSITPTGTENVMHSFIGGYDGALPLGTLTAVGSMLYGTTSSGGANNDGTVFAMSTGGSGYGVLHNFAGGSDGASPFAGLVELNGTLYGTTELGGKYNEGTVFSITPTGTETVIHSFGAKKDGAKPYSSLTVLNGTLYGTTAYGGTAKEGTIFQITPTGTETVLHSFPGGKGGRVPYANLTAGGSSLYGVTIWGGPRNVGTAFEYTP
jgi:uncharacterized repeat protein (TIGR03803 family)